MQSGNKSRNLYPHPFSLAYWRDAVGELKDTRILVFAALMIAVRVAMKLLAIPLAPGLKINTAFHANALGAMVFGPVMAALCAVLSDILGYLQNPEGVYFLPFLFQEVAGSVIFALFLYRARVTPIRTMLSRFCICVFVNMLLQIPIMRWYYSLYMGGKAYTMALALPGVIKNICMFPVESVVLTLFLSVMVPITNRLGLTFTGADAGAALKFTKQQLITLVLLFAVSVAALGGYLTYYYNTTNLITKSEGTQRYDANTAVTRALTEVTDEYDGQILVTTVTVSGRQFLSSRMHYTALLFRVDPEALAELTNETLKSCAPDADQQNWQDFDSSEAMLEYIRGLSKSYANRVAELGIMEPLGTVDMILNEKTGEVLSWIVE